MSKIAGGPRTKLDGLVMRVDAANDRSYIGSGNSWLDLSDQNNNGTLTNGPVFSTAFGGGIVFDGSNDYVTVPNSNSLSPTKTITISAWCRYNGTYTGFYAPIVFKKNTAVSFFEQYQLVYLTNGTVQVALGNGSSNQAATSPLSYTNQLINAVATIDTANSIIKIYVNGELKASTSIIYANMSISTSPLIIGGNAQAGFPGYMGGSIYQVSVYNNVLTDIEILQNYNALKGRFNL